MAEVSVSATITHNKLPQIVQTLPRACRTLLREEVLQVEADVKTNIVGYDAIDTGAMLNSVAGEMLSETHGRVSSPQEYSGFVNDGTVHMAARPFFTDAVETSRERLPKRFAALEGML